MNIKQRTAMVRKERYSKDLNYKIRTKARMMLRQALEGNYNSVMFQYIGMNREQLKDYLMLTAIRNGYNNFNPDKWTSEFHIDHITPIHLFDLTKERELAAAYSWTNLQILSKEDNLKKGRKGSK